MSYSEFEKKFLLAAYQLSHEYPGEVLKASTVMDSYLIAANDGWISQLIQDFSHRRLMSGRVSIGDERGQPVQLTVEGFREAERLIYSGVSVSKRTERSSGTAISQPSEPPHISSTRWTGLPTGFRLTNERSIELVSKLDAVEACLMSETHSTTLSQEIGAQARSYLLAAKALAEAPEPQADLIWEIINRANALSGIASLFVSILALFVG